jgi:transposase
VSINNSDTVAEFIFCFHLLVYWRYFNKRSSTSMSLKPSVIEPIPEETARIARAAFPKGNIYFSMRDELGIAFCFERYRTRAEQSRLPSGNQAREPLSGEDCSVRLSSMAAEGSSFLP